MGKSVGVCLIVAALCVMTLHAADSGQWWRTSLAVMAASNAADTLVSLQDSHNPRLHETGWLYSGRFDGRAVGIKSAVVGVQALGQWLIVRRHPRAAKWFAVLNFGESVGPLWSMGHNLELRGR
jgi:hypothetical protein